MSIRKRATAKHAAHKPPPETVTVTDAAGKSHEIPPGYQLVEPSVGPNVHGIRHQTAIAQAPDEKARAKVIHDIAHERTTESEG